MVYGRQYGEQLLSFEASGGLMDASLIMRDRETDSWWSIMTSTAIGGSLEGSALKELPIGEKTTWQDWKSRYPQTRVLSVDGVEHPEKNPYDDYFASEKTFRDIEVADKRLPPKEPIFSFQLDGEAFAVAHRTLTGGRSFALNERATVVLYRAADDDLHRSTRAYRWRSEEALSDLDLATLIAEGSEKLEPLAGFDTFWYSWVLVQSETRLLE